MPKYEFILENDCEDDDAAAEQAMALVKRGLAESVIVRKEGKDLGYAWAYETGEVFFEPA